MTLEALQNALELLSPYFYADMGIYIVLGFSILGSAIGIFNTGATLVTATIAHPEIRSKNLLSILFCEAIALYGVIMSIIILTAVKQGAETSLKGDYVTKQEVLKAGYGYGAAGISVGFSNFAAAITVGVLGALLLCLIVEIHLFSLSSSFRKFLQKQSPSLVSLVES